MRGMTGSHNIRLGARRRVREAGPVAIIEPADARKLVADAAAYAAGLGFAPHRDFRAVERIFGDVDAAAATHSIPFGRDGRPCYVPSPFEPRALVRQRLAQLERRLGADGFDHIIMSGHFD